MRNPLAQSRAIDLRCASTDAERKLWQRLRAKQICGAKFRRQVPIGPFIADFVCLSIKLIVEVDGSQHCNSSYDEIRDAYLRRLGFRVLRFWSHDVLLRTDSVVEAVVAAIKMPPP